MPNQILTTQLISNTSLALFSTNCPFINTASRMYQADFTSSGYQIGTTLQVKRQNNYLIGDGSVAVPQSIQEQVEEIKVEHQYHAMIEYTIQDLSLRIEDFSRLFLQPAIQGIIAKMEQDISRSAETELSMFANTSGTSINSFSSIDSAGTVLLKHNVALNQGDSYMALSIDDAATAKSGLVNFFTPMLNEEITRYSSVGHLSYFDVFQSQNIQRHVAGAGPTLFPGDTLTVNGAVASGSTIVLSGATPNITNYFLPGDLITIAGVDEWVNITGNTYKNAQFVILQPANSNGLGQVTIQVQILGNPIISDPTNTHRNVSNPIPDAAPVTVQGSYAINVAYPTRALDIVCPPLWKLEVPQVAQTTDEATGLSLTVTQIGNINTYQNLMRIDLLCGFKWHPQYACKVLGQ